MTLTKRRGLRALGTLCAASAILAAVPAGSAFAANLSGPSATAGDQKLKEALENAPELKGATIDVSGVKFTSGGMTPSNEKFTSTGSYLFFEGEQENTTDIYRDWTTISLEKSHTDTSSYVRSQEFGTSLAIGQSFKAEVKFEGIGGYSSDLSRTLTLSYKYTDTTWKTTSDTYTIKSNAQTIPLRPGHKVHVRQWVELGEYEADLTLNGVFTGNVIIQKCGNTVSVPIGRLASMKRDDGQGPLFEGSTPDGDTLHQSATVHWEADLAVKSLTRVADTLLADNTTTVSVTEDTPQPTPRARKISQSQAFADSRINEPVTQTLRSVIPCVTPSDLHTGGGAPREWAPLPVGTVAVGNHTFLRPDKTLTYSDWTVDRNVASVVGAWASGSGRDWATYVRDDGRAYTWLLDHRSSQFEGRFPVGTRAVGFRTYLTPAGDLYIESRRIARNVTSAIGGWSGTDWVSYISDGKGYGMSSGMGSPREEGAYPDGTRAIGNHAYLAPDGTLSFDGQVIATNVTSALGGWGNGGDWVTFVADGRGHSWSGRSHSTTDEVSLVDGAEVVGNHTYLDSEGYLYYVNNEVAQNVTSAVGGWGPGPDWATYTRDDS